MEDAAQVAEIVRRFEQLRQRTSELFTDLHDLPQFGKHQWQAYFSRTFQAFSELWSLQRSRRAVLEAHAGLRRFHIGEMASKIAQLYYHWYLRSSLHGELVRSFEFYCSIRERKYLSQDVLVAEANGKGHARKRKELHPGNAVDTDNHRQDQDKDSDKDQDKDQDKNQDTDQDSNSKDRSGAGQTSPKRNDSKTDSDNAEQQQPATLESLTDLCHKQRRYYARFAVVCLLLDKVALLQDGLLADMEQLQQYWTEQLGPVEGQQWVKYAAEIRDFVAAERTVVIEHACDAAQHAIRAAGQAAVSGGSAAGGGAAARDKRGTEKQSWPQRRLDGRLVQRHRQAHARESRRVTLEEAIIINTGTSSVKFSELTMDMFRMLQSLEQYGDSKAENPHKYLLYRPSVSHFLSFLACAEKELRPMGGMLLFISGDQEIRSGADGVALKTCNSREQEFNVLLPSDLAPFTRRPLFIILDCPNSKSFERIQSPFDQPLMLLYGPRVSLGSRHRLFPLFLSSFLEGLCCLAGVTSVAQTVWMQLEELYGKVVSQLDTILCTSPGSLRALLCDAFLHKFVINFLLFNVTVSLCVDYSPAMFASSAPVISVGDKSQVTPVRTAVASMIRLFPSPCLSLFALEEA
eukprot:m.33428 g.33428  ORF g.33428 m.33428 type:complete len:632 (-) comp12893_c0_seq1:31-1926(-)